MGAVPCRVSTDNEAENPPEPPSSLLALAESHLQELQEHQARHRDVEVAYALARDEIFFGGGSGGYGGGRRIQGRRRQHSGSRGSSRPGSSRASTASGMDDGIPLELLPNMHPSHAAFRGHHPLFGRSEVQGFLPPTPSTMSRLAPSRSAPSLTVGGGGPGYLGYVHPPPESPFLDVDRLHWDRNITPVPRRALGATVSRGTGTARASPWARRWRMTRGLKRR